MLHLYRRMLAARRSSPALAGGAFAWLPSPDGVLAWERADGASGDRRLVAVNFGGAPVEVDLDGTVVVASDGRGEGKRYCGVLAADQAVVLSP
jgi:alpha-glucosidase